MNEKRICPIDSTKLTPFNQYQLQDGIICRDCAKKIGLIDDKKNNLIALAAKSLLTIAVANDYYNNDKALDINELLNSYNSEQPILDSNDSDDETTEDTTANPESNEDDDQESSEPITQVATPNSKKEPTFWKGDGISGFMYGLVTGAVVGVINMIFLNIWHLGVICWIIIWLFVGTNPKFKDRRTPEEQLAPLKSHIDEVQKNTAEKQQVTFTTNSKTERKSKKPLFHGLVCPKCHSANVQLVASDANIKKIKTKTRVNADLNPLHPFRLANVKQRTKVVKKHSAAKTASAMATMGASTLITGGTRSNKSREYHCQDCGKVFYKK